MSRRPRKLKVRYIAIFNEMIKNKLKIHKYSELQDSRRSTLFNHPQVFEKQSAPKIKKPTYLFKCQKKNWKKLQIFCKASKPKAFIAESFIIYT